MQHRSDMETSETIAGAKATEGSAGKKSLKLIKYTIKYKDNVVILLYPFLTFTLSSRRLLHSFRCALLPPKLLVKENLYCH